METQNTGVVTVDDPGTSQGATPDNTLENLNANVINALVSPTGASTGAAPDAATQVPGEPDAAPATPVEGTTPAEADEAKMHRVSQDNANLRATLLKIGIEPDSNVAEQLRTGVINLDDIIRSRQPVVPATSEASPQAAPEVSLDQKVSNLKSILNAPIPQNGYSSEDVQERNNAFMNVIAGQAQQIENITKSQEKKEFAEKSNRMVAATSDVFNSTVVTELSAELPEEVRQIGSEMFLGGVDIENIGLQEEIGTEKAITPEGYRHSAMLVAPKMKQFIQAIFKAGQNSMNPTLTPTTPTTPTTPRTNVQALRPGGGPTPAPPVSKDKFNINNLVANVNEELSRQQQRTTLV